jgi:hypothetical protein
MARGSRPFAVLGLLTLLLATAGCVPVTEPLSDPAKAEPDKRLLGKWAHNEKEDFEIDIPAVKGNPKGLMRSVWNGKADDMSSSFWFFTTTIGKHIYGTLFYQELDGQLMYADFRKEGAFEKWKKQPNRLYLIVQFVLDGDNLIMDEGDDDVMKKLMKAERIETQPTRLFHKIPPGWLAKYLEKNGPEELYNRRHVGRCRRLEK